MARTLFERFLTGLVYFLIAAELGPWLILSAVFALFVAAFTLSVLFVSTAGFITLAVLPLIFGTNRQLLDSFKTAYLLMNLALLFLGLLLMLLSVAVSRGCPASRPRPRPPSSIVAAEFLLSRALNVSIAAIFLSSCLLINLMDGER